MTEDESRVEREFDIVVWGATGFTGRLVAEYLARMAKPVRWAMAGRNQSKLASVRAEIAKEHPAAEEIALLTADAGDTASLEALAAKTRVIATTVGPYRLYGGPLVGACVAQKTDYCDLTGETPFMRETIDRHHERARQNGTRIVHTCGFDSIPSDLGVFVLAEHAREHAKRPLAEVRAYVMDSSGGLSGGTAASMLHIMEAAERDPGLRRLLADPYSLSPERAREPNTDTLGRMSPHFDADLGAWSAPWVMAMVNGPVVRRSNALFDYAYGRSLRYSEELLAPGGALGVLPAAGITAGMGLFMGLMALGPTRKLLANKLPKPGEGPSKKTREQGHFTLRMVARLEGDETPSLLARVSGKGDPGYAATSRMLAESALSLAFDPKVPGFEGGVLTPATAMGMHLVKRLRQSDMSFDVEPFRRF